MKLALTRFSFPSPLPSPSVAATAAAHCVRQLAAWPSCSHNCCTHSRSQVEKWPGAWQSACPPSRFPYLQCICTQMLFIFSPNPSPLSLVQQVGPAGSLITFYWRARTQARSGPGWPTFWPDNFLIPKPLPCTAAVRAAEPELLLN